jgi:hypothetical protein
MKFTMCCVMILTNGSPVFFDFVETGMNGSSHPNHENKHDACGHRHTEWKYRGHFHIKSLIHVISGWFPASGPLRGTAGQITGF